MDLQSDDGEESVFAAGRADRSGRALARGPMTIEDALRWDLTFLRHLMRAVPELVKNLLLNFGRGYVLDSDWSGVKFHDIAFQQLQQGMEDVGLDTGLGITQAWHAADINAACRRVLLGYKSSNIKPMHVFGDVRDVNAGCVNRFMDGIIDEGRTEMKQRVHNGEPKDKVRYEIGQRIALDCMNKLLNSEFRPDVHCFEHGCRCQRQWQRDEVYAPNASLIRFWGTPCDTWSSRGKQEQLVHPNTAGLCAAQWGR